MRLARNAQIILAAILVQATTVHAEQQPVDGGVEAPPQVEQPEAPASPRPTKLTVATKLAPPFSLKNPDGSWTGLSIELWRRIAAELNLEYEIVEVVEMREMVKGLADGRFQAGVAATTVTAEREALIDFSHPFYTTGLGIAVASEQDTSLTSAILGLFSLNLLRPIGALLGVLLLVGLAVWFFERKRNAAQFGGSTAAGIGAGFWYSAVTMTTVGYGDKAPVTLGGRIIGLIWMFVSVVTISSFTAGIASALTVSQLGSAISGPDDLPNVRVGSVDGTTSAEYLRSKRITFHAYDTPGEGLLAVAAGEVDAMVYDSPILRYHVTRRFEGRVRVLPLTFERQDYAIGLPSNSPLREEINRDLLRQIASQWWDDTIYNYLGRR